MYPRALCVAFAVVLSTGCAGGSQPADPAIDIVKLLPPVSELPGWTIAEGPTVHSSETLYEYLNGGADRYVTCGFRRLAHVRYQLGDDPFACVTLDIYDMGDDLGAFGIYSAGRPPGVELRRWGAEGYRAGSIAGAYKGRIFVHAMADDDRPQLLEMVDLMVARVVDAATGSVSPPAVLDLLPTADRMAGSERYIPTDLKGYSFLPGGVLATYTKRGRRADLFFSDLGSEAAASQALSTLQTHLARRGTVSGVSPPIGDDGFRVIDPILGSQTVVRAGRFVAGIHGRLSAEEREVVLGQLVATLIEL